MVSILLISSSFSLFINSRGGSRGTNSICHYHYSHDPYFFQFSSKVQLFIYFSSSFIFTQPERENSQDNTFFFLFNQISVFSQGLARQRPTKQQLYGHLPPITKTIQVMRTRPAGHCWRSRDEFISDIVLWTPSHGRAKVGRPAITYTRQLCADTGCSLEDLPRAMDDRDRWRERVREIRAGGAT